MLVECPHCQSNFQLDDKEVAFRTEVTVSCPSCKQTFSVPTTRETAKTAAPSRSRPPATRKAEGTAVSVDPDTLALPPNKRISLSVLSGPQKGLIFECNKPRVLIGRTGADLNLDDSEISRQHCAIEIAGNLMTLIDLNSTNGTFVEERRIQREALGHLSEFRVGAVSVLVTVTSRG